MPKILTACLALLMLAGCSKQLNPAEREEARRAELELQGVMDMVSSRQIPPIEFELGSARLMPTSFQLLDRVAAILNNHSRLKLIVSGHTDDTGSEAFNDNLSLQRASAVKLYLAKKGVHPESVRIFGHGESLPVLNETTDQARALNRRVEFRITTRDWGTVY
ncbi:MAG: OmpA family protein [Elusimicrobiales bacterium]|nr:OmpA family protein [Elusimicrobiales bacterium]